jgi:hypothetical protein
MLDRFQDQGITDYLAFCRARRRVPSGWVQAEGLVASWTTDAPSGFTDAQIELLRGLMRR